MVDPPKLREDSDSQKIPIEREHPAKIPRKDTISAVNLLFPRETPLRMDVGGVTTAGRENSDRLLNLLNLPSTGNVAVYRLEHSVVHCTTTMYAYFCCNICWQHVVSRVMSELGTPAAGPTQQQEV